MTEPLDSAIPWVAEHTQKYVANDGEEGHIWPGVPCLVDEPNVGVQVANVRFDAAAHVAADEEKTRLWPAMTQIWPAYDEYQAKTEREIPVVVLTRA